MKHQVVFAVALALGLAALPSTGRAQVADDVAVKSAIFQDGITEGVEFFREAKVRTTAQGDLRPTGEGDRWLRVQFALTKATKLPLVVSKSSLKGVIAVATDGVQYPVLGLGAIDAAIKLDDKKGTLTMKKLPAHITLLFIVPSTATKFDIAGMLPTSIHVEGVAR